MQDVSEEPGRGVRATWLGQDVALRQPDSAAGIATALAIGSRPVRLITFADRLRPDAEQALAELKARTKQAIHNNAIFSVEPQKLRFDRRQIHTQRPLLGRLTRLPFIAIAKGSNDAEISIAQIPRCSPRNGKREISRQVIPTL